MIARSRTNRANESGLVWYSMPRLYMLYIYCCIVLPYQDNSHAACVSHQVFACLHSEVDSLYVDVVVVVVVVVAYRHGRKPLS